MNDDTGQQETSRNSVDVVHDYIQDNSVQPIDLVSVDKLIRRCEDLQKSIDESFLSADEGDVDYDKVESMSREIEVIAQKIESLPVTSLAIAKKKIEFFMSMIKSDHPDPTKVNIFKSKILGVFANYSSARKFGSF